MSKHNQLTRLDLASSMDAMADHRLLGLRGKKSGWDPGAGSTPILVRAGSLPLRTINDDPAKE